jgi:hypothetical protein
MTLIEMMNNYRATTAAMADVLPVPAYPFTTRMSPSSEHKKLETSCSSDRWQGVASYGKCAQKAL